MPRGGTGRACGRGEKQLLAIVGGTYSGRLGNYPIAIDIRPHAAWIDQVLASRDPSE